MKKFLFALIAVIMCVPAAFARSGDMGLGIDLGAAPCLEKGSSVTNFILGVKYQYQATSLIRLQADVDFGFKSKSISTFNAMANVHFLVPCARNFYIYPLAGLGYGSVKVDYGDVTGSHDKFAFNIGLGCEYDIASNWAVDFEIKYQYMQDFNRLPILVGLTYKF